MTEPATSATIPSDKLIIALDLPTGEDARKLVVSIGDACRFYKVGLQLFTAEGPKFVQHMIGEGRKVFLDLKFHDIPNTVSSAVRSVCTLGVDMLTVHAAGGSAMLRAALEASKAASKPPLVLAVTVLTSMDAASLSAIGVTGSPADQVLNLALLAKEAGCGGVVASPQEAAMLRKALGPEMAIVTPGVRPVGADKGDQSRVATPAEAIRSGASHIVVGRPITAAPDPAAAARQILAELA